MGCSSSKVKDTATDPSVHSAAAAAIAIAANNSGRPTSDTKQLQKDLRKRVDNVRKRRQKQDALHPEERDRGRHRHSSSSSSGSDSISSSTSSSSSEEDRRRRRRNRRRRRRQERQQEDQGDPQQQRELRTQPYQEGIEPLGYGMVSSPRGTLSASQKQQASNGIAAELSSVHFASPQPPPPLPNRSETLANICTDDLCGSNSSSWCPSDRFPAEMAKLAAERDEALRELLYLRTMAAATNGFQDEPRRVPVEWVPSEHRKIEELYRNNVRLHREYGALRHTYRKLLASTTTSPASHDSRRIHSSSPHNNRTAVPTPLGLPLFPDVQQDRSADLAGVAPPSRPLSPTALAESIHSLHDSYDQLQQRCREAQRTLEDTTQARVAAAEALECTALRLRWEELRAALELTPRLEYAFRGVIGSEEDSARTAVLLEMSKLPSPPPPSTTAAEEANTNDNDTSKSKVVIGVLEDEWEVAAKDCGFPARTSPLTVVSMLSQLAQFLIDHKSCPSRTRMELMQTVLEHAGRSVKGIDPIVSDSTTLDFSSCGFGDSLAQLSSIVLSRLNCRVTKLSLSDSGLTDLGLARISMVLAVLPYEVPLSVLNLSSNELSCRSVVQLLTAFMGCGGVGPGKLRHKLLIDLRNNEPILESLESAWAVLQEVEQLKRVNTNVEVLLSPIPKAMLAEVATRHARAGSMIVHAGPPL